MSMRTPCCAFHRPKGSHRVTFAIAARVALPGVLLLAAATGQAYAAPSLQVFVLSVGGASTYSTYGAPQAVFDFFGPRGVGIPSNPAGLAASGISGSYELQSAAAGPLRNSDSVTSPVFISDWSSANQYSGTAAAVARYGLLGAEAHGTYTGWGSSNTVAGSESFAIFQDTLTVTSLAVPAGAAGAILLHITVDGNMTSTGDAGTGGIEVNYQVNGGPIYSLMHASVDPRGGGFYPFSGPGRAGFSISDTAISGSGVFDTFSLPFTFGTPFDTRIGLLASVVPQKNNVEDVVFSSTVRVSGIDIFGPGGQVAGFSIASGSGTVYDAIGAHQAGDVNNDGHVDVIDLLNLVDAFGSASGDPNYNVACDFNGDGSVDVVDLLYMIDNFGT